VTRLDIDPIVFRQLLGRFATGVTVLTTRDPAGRPAGMTASSLAAVSLAPPLVSVCVDLGAEMHQVLSGAEAFTINILSAGQEAVSRRFSQQPAEGRFQGIGWRETDDGLILLDGTLAHLVCERYADFPLGDHTLFVGRVTGGDLGEHDPLVHFRGEYVAIRRP